jgi:hypothetical protein
LDTPATGRSTLDGYPYCDGCAPFFDGFARFTEPDSDLAPVVDLVQRFGAEQVMDYPNDATQRWTATTTN